MATYVWQYWSGTSATTGNTTTNAATWRVWADAEQGTSSATTYQIQASSTNAVWGTWAGVDSVTVGGTTTNDQIWIQWQPLETIEVREYGNPTPYRVFTAPINRTPEEIAEQERLAQEMQAERERRDAQQRAQQEERAKLAELAKIRAEDLLLSLLNARQRREWKTKKQISIYDGRVLKWILKNESTYNIVECDAKGEAIKTHCVVPRESVPLADQLAMQYLYLNGGCQEELIRVANHQIVRA